MFDVIVKEDTGEVLAHIHCNERSCTVGKARGNLIQLKGWKIGGVHAQIEQNEKGIFVEDLGAGIGTLVNSARVDTYGPVRSSDEIKVGPYILNIGVAEVEEVEPEAAAAPVHAPVHAPAQRRVEEEEDYSPGGVVEETPEQLEQVVQHLRSALPEVAQEGGEAEYEERFMWRNRIHRQLLRMMDLRRTDLDSMDESALRDNALKLIDEIITHIGERLPSTIDREQLAKEVLDEAIGLGPLEDLLADDEVTEIMVNNAREIFVAKGGKLQASSVTFSSDLAVLSAIERIVSPLGRRIDESSPMVDARLKDGSRVNAIIPPLALKGPCLTIRKFSKKKLQAGDLVAFKALDARMVMFLTMCVMQHKNIIISGGTGSGKTTLLNVMSNFIPVDERIVTVEDAAELQLNQPHVVSLEARPPNLEGKGAVPIRELVRNCLRMRPDRIVVGECRGGEALDMLQAMNTGHDGSLTTAHANTPRDLISRLEVMVMMAGMDLPAAAIREQVASAVDIIVQQNRFSDGSRRVTAITEVTGVESGVIQMQDIFRFQQEGFDENHRVRGQFVATGAIPEFYEDMRARGIGVDLTIFK